MPQGIDWREYDPPSSELIPLDDAAELCGLTADHLRRLARNGELWAIRPARDWLTTKVAIIEYIARDRRPGRKSQ